MSAPRNLLVLLAASALLALPAAAQSANETPAQGQPTPGDVPQTTGTGEPAGSAAPMVPPVPSPPPPEKKEAAPAVPGAPAGTREELHRDVQEEVRREMEKAKQEMRDEVSYVEAAEDARSYDARQLKELKQTANLLQLHGYFRSRGNFFNHADLGRGGDQATTANPNAGFTLFPVSTGTPWVGAADMRLRLNPVLRVSDSIAVYSQIDVLDNAVYGGNPLAEPFFDPTTAAQMLESRIAGSFIQVKRVWAEVETPVGQLAFGRKGFHWGEGMFYNDGNCLDCDYGNTFDRIQLTVGPFLHHLVTLAADSIAEGPTTANNPGWQSSFFPTPNDLQQIDDAYRFSLAIERATPQADTRKLLDNGEWVLNYGAFVAYRFQHSAAADFAQTTSPNPVGTGNIFNVNGSLFEADAYAQLLFRKLRLATEWAGVKGGFSHIINASLAGPGAPNGTGLNGLPNLDITQGAGIVRGQYALLKQDALLLGVDAGIASGDGAPGMGSMPGRPGTGVGGIAAKNAINGPQFCQTAATGCTDHTVTNFRMNPDFRIDQLLWRNLFVSITDAWFARAEARYKLGGRASGGADDEGFEFMGSAVYSQAIMANSTPAGNAKPLGVEFDASVTYTSRDRFFAGLVAGFLLPLDGLNNPLLPGDAGTAKLGQVYRAFLATTF